MTAKKSSPKPAKRPPTKSAILNSIAADTSLSRKEVAAVLKSLEGLIAKELKPHGAGYFNLLNMLKIKVVKKPARKARKGTNPFTGEEMMFKTKPATKSVRVLPLKGLKNMV